MDSEIGSWRVLTPIQALAEMILRCIHGLLQVAAGTEPQAHTESFSRPLVDLLPFLSLPYCVVALPITSGDSSSAQTAFVRAPWCPQLQHGKGSLPVTHLPSLSVPASSLTKTAWKPGIMSFVTCVLSTTWKAEA